MRALLLLIACTAMLRAETQKFAYEKAEMGIRFTVTLFAENEETAKRLADGAFARIAELNKIFSDYEDDSELSRLSRTSGTDAKVPLSAPLWHVLERSIRLAEESGGAFDPTCGPLTATWRRARRKGELPSPALVEEMKARCGWRKLRLLPDEKSALLASPDMRLDLGAIAKGYACDEALRFLREKGHGVALVAGAGDMAAGEPPPGRKGWRIAIDALDTADGIAKPDTVIVEIANCGIATSGDRFQRLEIEGKRYSHILDLRTGVPVTDHSLVSVIAPDCMTADSLSTTLSVLGPKDGSVLAAKYNAVARWQRQPAQEVEIIATPGWEKWIFPEPSK
ncbi:MAG: Thiamine biosynthesis lipoprotein ApbE precursor [Verrucomicrobiota bacterium]|jgi:thiamine biosynthesis lipoprotein